LAGRGSMNPSLMLSRFSLISRSGKQEKAVFNQTGKPLVFQARHKNWPVTGRFCGTQLCWRACRHTGGGKKQMKFAEPLL
jgi:hypothetical protein